MGLRHIVLGILLCVGLGNTAACIGSQSAETADSGGDEGAMAPDERDDGISGSDQCQTAADCVLAASTCCECPSFAVEGGQGYDAGCEDVDCEAPADLCPAVEAICDFGQCVMVCSPIITDKICAFGFERDAAGCLTNICAGPPLDASVMCVQDTDCVQVPADCCGCSRGGVDHAVPTSDAQEALTDLNCPSAPACPEINVCDADLGPRCIGGACALAASAPGSRDPEDDEVLCGSSELPACPDGFQCVLNDLSAKNASDLGVGLCAAD